jgi:hypothetical protein
MPSGGGGGISSGGGSGSTRSHVTPMHGNITQTMHGIDRLGLGRPVNIR